MCDCQNKNKLYIISCSKCGGNGQMVLYSKFTKAGKINTYGKCDNCNGLGSLLISEERLNKII